MFCSPPRDGTAVRSVHRPAVAAAATALGAATLLIFAAGALATTTGADPSADIDELSVFAAIVLGLVEGLTEYLPVSSTGHLLVTNEILGLAQTEEAETALDTYAICIQAGAIAAVFVLYRERIRQMLDGLLGRSEEGRQVLLGVIVAFIPTAIIGLALVDLVRERLFGIGPIAAAWLVGGIGILFLTRSGVMNRGGLELGQLTARHAVIIGVAQAIAMWPG
ncbi:MAG: undecaprenyl-diphosphate phosphatase, partial [Actinomycetota bacterium]